ncbi:DUF3332 domain-containing protein [Aquimarina sp. 2201CG5-10]|uniref:DUF3332 domain-containing protein n=1 Tax=Aquimarina callyspongiae TaxID=3098150 RepID=UPI002AB47C05|nr:DUF3332 domain-containing protein [Aquimarina sp. 2201CG5-10]MDY8135041.1 DUF3332 domain-containing protein [Aquimarina sp. 2201CG5-10]
MKKLTVCILLSTSILFSSCLGSFSAFNGLRDWNDGLTDSKFLDNLIFWGLNIVPVYGLFVLGDVLIFNVIEFWSGSNPIAMKEGDREIQVVEKEGNTYEMIATKNRLQIKIIDGDRKGEKLDLVYSPSDKSWSAIKPNGEVIKLSSFEEGFYVVHLPDGEKVKIDPLMPRNEGLALLQNKTVQYENCLLAEVTGN